MADYFVIPGSLTTQLEAVNALLGSIDQAPVATLDPSPSTDVDQALAALNDVDREVQTRGWNWNREYAYPLALDGSGEVPLPALTLSVTRAYFNTSTNSDATSMRIAQRGTRLYDQDAHSFTFTAAPVVDCIIRLPWDQLPEAARRYITLLACQRYHAQKQGVSVVLQINAGDIRQAWVTLLQREDEEEGFNTITKNEGVQRALNGSGGLRRRR